MGNLKRGNFKTMIGPSIEESGQGEHITLVTGGTRSIRVGLIFYYREAMTRWRYTGGGGGKV